MSNEPRQTFVTTPDDLRIAMYDWGGASDAPPVLLAHPTGFHGRVWQPLAHRLTALGLHCYALDFRGHGDSDRTDGDYAWSGFATDVLTVTDALGLVGREDLLAVGLSKGGAALLLAELDAPGTYGRLWLYEPIVFPIDEAVPEDAEAPLAAVARRRRASWPSLEEARAAYASKPPLDVLHPDALDAYVTYGLRHTGAAEWVLRCAPEDEARMYTMGIRHHGWARLAEVQTPTVIACGAHTDALTPAMAAKLVERLPRGTLDVWADAGHFGPLADPDRAAAAISAAR